MAVASVAYLLIYGVAPDLIAAQRMIAGVESFPLLAVPFFILAGNLMNIAGVTGRIYAFALALVGWMKGGPGAGQHHRLGDLLRHVGNRAGGCRRHRHDRDQGDEGPWLSGGGRGRRHRRVGDAGADLPPSLPFVIYGMMANVSIGALFMGGILPGVVMTMLDDDDRRDLRLSQAAGDRTRRSRWRSSARPASKSASCFGFPVLGLPAGAGRPVRQSSRSA